MPYHAKLKQRTGIYAYVSSSNELLIHGVRKHLSGQVDGIKETPHENQKLVHNKKCGIYVFDIDEPMHEDFVTLSALKANAPTCYIILSTRTEKSGPILEALNAGVDTVIGKNYSDGQLETALAKGLQGIAERKQYSKYRQDLRGLIERHKRQLGIKSLRFEHQLHTDRITGLLSRVRLLEQLREPGSKTLMLISIANFDELNTGFGHEIGDIILKVFADFLQKDFHIGDIFRLHGAVFGILIPGAPLERVEEYSQAILTSARELVIEAGSVDIKVTLNIGAFTGDDPKLLYYSQLALHEAQRASGANFFFYDRQMDLEKQQIANVGWILKLQHFQDNIVPFFQPIVDVETQQAVKYECLMRYEDVERVASPGEFMGPAEISSLMPDLSRIMIEKSIQVAGQRGVDISLNISGQDVHSGYLKDYLIEMTNRYSVAPQRITLEILEDLIQPAESQAGPAAVIEELRALGFKTALDDFGTAHSNISRLGEYKPDFLKIDGQFIRDLPDNLMNKRICRIISQFGHAIGAKMIAEYVHSKQVFACVKDLGIQYAQGYYFGAPAPVPEFK